MVKAIVATALLALTATVAAADVFEGVYEKQEPESQIIPAHIHEWYERTDWNVSLGVGGGFPSFEDTGRSVSTGGGVDIDGSIGLRFGDAFQLDVLDVSWLQTKHTESWSESIVTTTTTETPGTHGWWWCKHYGGGGTTTTQTTAVEDFERSFTLSTLSVGVGARFGGFDLKWARPYGSVGVNATGISESDQSRSWTFGWSAGAGVEIPLSRHSAVGVRYRYKGFNERLTGAHTIGVEATFMGPI